MVFNVSYDLHQPGRDYTDLIAEIKTLGAWCHVLESYWLVDTSETLETIFTKLRAKMDNNDSLFIVRVTSPYKGWISQDRWTWIHEHVK